MVDMLIHNGADPTIRAPLGETALYIAASRNYVHGFVKKTSAPVFPCANAMTACARVSVYVCVDEYGCVCHCPHCCLRIVPSLSITALMSVESIDEKVFQYGREALGDSPLHVAVQKGFLEVRLQSPFLSATEF